MGRRVMRDTLAPYSQQLEILSISLEESTSFSKRARISTKYMRFVNDTRCGNLDHLIVDFEYGAKVSHDKVPHQQRNISDQRGRVGRQSSMRKSLRPPPS